MFARAVAITTIAVVAIVAMTGGFV